MYVEKESMPWDLHASLFQEMGPSTCLGRRNSKHHTVCWATWSWEVSTDLLRNLSLWCPCSLFVIWTGRVGRILDYIVKSGRIHRPSLALVLFSSRRVTQIYPHIVSFFSDAGDRDGILSLKPAWKGTFFLRLWHCYSNVYPALQFVRDWLFPGFSCHIWPAIGPNYS